MGKYEVRFKEEPKVRFVESARGVVSKYKKELGENLGFDVEEKIKFEAVPMWATIREGDFTKEEFLKVTDKYKDRVMYEIKLRLGDLQKLAEEVISKDTGVNVKGKVKVRVDWFVYTVSIHVLKEELSEEEVRQLGDYGLGDGYKNTEEVVKSYYYMLGDKGDNRGVKVSKRDVGEDLDEYCKIRIDNR